MTQDKTSSEMMVLQEEPSAATVPHAPAHKAAPRAPLRRATPSQPAAPLLQPSWVLSAAGEQLTREELLARYRRQRMLPEDPFETEPPSEPPRGYPDSIMSERHGTRSRERARPAAPSARPSPRSFTAAQTFAIAAATALVAGGSAGVLSTHLMASQAAGPVAGGAAVLDATPFPLATLSQVPEANVAGDSLIEKKPVPTATLQVEDVIGETNSFIPLALHAVPAGLDTDMLLKISGLPEGAYLTSGHRQDDKIWTLSLAETKDVNLVIPRADDPQIDLAIAAFESRTGELAAPVKTMIVALRDVIVEPASAPPPDLNSASSASMGSITTGTSSAGLPASIPPPFSNKLTLAVPESTETANLINGADALLSGGDVAAARRGYERAWGNDGSAVAAFGLARSYDPLVLLTLPATNATPDKSQAMQWYQRAAAAGHADAGSAIALLQMN